MEKKKMTGVESRGKEEEKPRHHWKEEIQKQRWESRGNANWRKFSSLYILISHSSVYLEVDFFC